MVSSLNANNELEPYSIRRLNFDDFEWIAQFEARASDYSLFMTGLLPKPEDALDLLSQPNSLVFGVFLEACLVGILQVFQLEPQIDAIGLLLLEPNHRRKKLASNVFEMYRIWALTRGVQKIVVSVSLENTVGLAFWCSLGFEFGVSNPEPAFFGVKTHVMQNLELDLKTVNV
jgi:GNAT superfamily N-acetyltransferase